MQKRTYYNNENKQYILHFPGEYMFGVDICELEINRKIKVSKDITICSPMTANYVENSYIKKQCDFNNIKLMNSEIALNTKVWNAVDKITMIIEMLEQVDTEYTLILDGKDTIIVNDLDKDFINTYKEYNVDILFNADVSPFPSDYREYIPKEAIEYHTKFLNSGICFGKTNALLEMFREIQPIVKWNRNNSGGDQVLIKMYIKEIRRDNINIDYMTKLFTIIHNVNNGKNKHLSIDYRVDGNKVYLSENYVGIKYFNKDNNQISILHFPGEGYKMYGEIFNKLEKNRIFKMSNKLSLISIMTKDFYEDSTLRYQCDLNGVKIYNTGLDATNWNNTLKIDFILKALEQIDTEYALITDGRDVLIANDLDDNFLNKYLSMGKDIVYNSTKFRFPDVVIEPLYDILAHKGEFKYLNAGVCIGKTASLKKFYNICKEYNKKFPNNYSEQFIVRTARVFGDREHLSDFDSESKLFRTIHSKDNSIIFNEGKTECYLTSIENTSAQTKITKQKLFGGL